MHGVLKPGLEARFKKARAAREHAPADVAAGREAVAAYVDFLHYVDGVYGAAAGGTHTESAETETHHQH
jgi:hypothetical protein